MTQITSRTPVAISSPITDALAQPHIGAYEMASRPVTSQADIRAAPSQLMRPGARTGDSDTNR